MRRITLFAGNRGCGKAIGHEVGSRGIWVAAVATLIALVIGAPAQAVGVSGADPAAAAGGARAGDSGSGLASVAVLDVVMLVDESGSETDAKVADEKQTVGTIVQSMLNPRSRVTVVGFGGVNHVAPNQDPVSVVCQPTVASGAANLSYLASCVGGLHRRTEAEGDDTDYAAALGQAMSYFNPNTTYGKQSPSGAIKVILMMTDGAVDVHRDTQQYGTNWLQGEQAAVNQQLAAARTDGVQVWPLGFGTDIGTGITEALALTYLNTIAAGAAPAVCDTRHVANQPHATWVNDPADAISALDQLYADAACLGSSTSSTQVGGGQTSGLSLTIPDIASDAVISVDRGNPGIQVGFSLPGGQQWTDFSAISGQDTSPVEVLHVANITSNEVRTWHIKLTAPPGLASQLVSATVFWQGAVRALITANPPSAKLGQPIAVALSVLGPNGPISDPSTLNSLLVGVTVSGDGLPSPVRVPVSNAGETGSANGVGDYKGTYTAPNQSGTLTFTGTAAGYGLYATQVPATVAVGTAAAGFTAAVQFPVVASVQAGSSVTGHVLFTNQPRAATQVRLQLSTSGTNASITSPNGPVNASSANPASVPFTISFNSDSPTGSAWLEVKVVDAANPGAVYNDATLNLTVTKPPGFIAKYLWDIIGLIALIILAILAVLWRRAVIRRRKDVRGLIAILRHNGEQLGKEFPAPNRWSDAFRFIIRDEGEPTARLDFPAAGYSEYLVRRSGPGEVKLRTPAGGEPYDVVVGAPGETMDHNGLELAFREARPRRVRGGRSSRPSARTTRPQPGSQPTSQPKPSTTPQPTSSPPLQSHGPNGQGNIPSGTPGPKDEWL